MGLFKISLQVIFPEHPNETTLIKVTSDQMLANVNSQFSFFILLKIPATCDTAVHSPHLEIPFSGSFQEKKHTSFYLIGLPSLLLASPPNL